LLTPSSPGGLPTLSLTTNSSWLPWGRVAMPLISPLMPVPHYYYWSLKTENELALHRTEMRMIRWMCGVRLRYKLSCVEVKRQLGIEDIASGETETDCNGMDMFKKG